jgi:AraC-like DNA-binding protein
MKKLPAADVCPVVRFSDFNSLEEGSSWGPRRNPDIELILVTAGEFFFETCEKVITVTPGELLFIQPGLEHTFGLKSENPLAGFWYIHLELLSQQRWLDESYCAVPSPREKIYVGGDKDLESCFRRSSEVLAGYGKNRKAMLEVICREMWLRLAEYWEGAVVSRLAPRTLEMIEWVRVNLKNPISRRDLARKFFLTPEHINAIFKRELGVSPTQFIHRERILLANKLMKTRGLNIKEVAEQVGFCDQFYFSKIFKRLMGVAPSLCSNRSSAFINSSAGF